MNDVRFSQAHLSDVTPPDSPFRRSAYWTDMLRPFGHGPRLLPDLQSDGVSHDAPAEAACSYPERCRVPLDTVGLAAVVLVASRYNGGEGVLIATPADPDGGAPSFVAPGPIHEHERSDVLLERLRQSLDNARAHGPCRLDEVGTALGLDAAEQQRAFLQLGYACGPATRAAALRMRVGLLVHVEPRGTDIHVVITSEERPGRSHALLSQLARHIARAMAWLAEGANQPSSAFDLLSPEERQQIGGVFNDTRVPLPSGLTLHGLVEAQASRSPAAIAVVHDDVQLTYQALDGQANHLATILRRDYHVAPGACVGVMMERSHQSIVSFLAVMKAGAAYVPVNPRHPWDTIRYMLDNAGITVLVVDGESIAGAARFTGELVVADMELRGSPEAQPVAAQATENDLAYVIYTSGSTGQPKGVAIEHRAIVNTILWRNAFYGIGPTDVNLQLPAFAFDSSVVDIFCVLSGGGTLVVPDESMRLDARRLLQLSVERGVTSCIATPSYYKVLLTELAGAVPSLRWVTLAGEATTPGLVAAHLATLPDVALYNEYGPTEHAVCSTACRLDTAASTVTIGRPIWNDVVLILDAQGRLLPVGVPGEIYLGGAGLARGYLHQEALTAERFVSSPAPDVCGGMLYRTGDRACWRSDGTLEFLGRLDSQVKIRGFRIELDHVELALLRHPAVGSAAVIRKDDFAGSAYLSAYVESDESLTRADLREHMAAQVPGYMIPDAFTVMVRLPLNLNGKIDRVALARRDDFRTDADAATVSPSSLQSSLISLWADILKRDRVALDDDFFDLGGNSLRVMELTSRIRGELTLSVELLDVYTYPTVRGLADRLTRSPS